METGQEFAITGNSPIYDQNLEDMGIVQIFETQEYIHAYRIWKNIAANECTWVDFKENLQEAYLDREES